MKLQTKSLTSLREACEVRPGNIYPAKGGRKPGTDYWLVVAVSAPDRIQQGRRAGIHCQLQLERHA